MKKTYYQNPFYDTVFGFFDVIVPSKRIRYKQREDKTIELISVPRGTQEFESYIKNSISKDTDIKNWPLKDNLLVVLDVSLTKKEFKSKDIDNVSKSLLDSLNGVVYEDDNQISTLVVTKNIRKTPGFFVAIKCLKETGRGIELPSFFSNAPYD